MCVCVCLQTKPDVAAAAAVAGTDPVGYKPLANTREGLGEANWATR